MRCIALQPVALANYYSETCETTYGPLEERTRCVCACVRVREKKCIV